MKQILHLLFLIAFTGCDTQTNQLEKNISGKSPLQKDQSSNSEVDGLDTSYRKLSSQSKLTGYFNSDQILDTAFFTKQVSTDLTALIIRHGGTTQQFIFRNGKEIGSDFSDFNWVEQVEVIKKGTVIWNNVDNGEIVGENEVSDNKKILLKTDGILMHVDEGSGGGIVYFKDRKYEWVQQD